MEKLKDVEGLAEALGIKKATMYIWIRENRYNLKSHLFKVGNLWRIDGAGFDSLIQDIRADQEGS